MKALVLLFALIGLASTGNLAAQSSQPEVLDPSKIKIFHRYDLRRKVDGKYQGLVYGQAQGVWTVNLLGADKNRVEAVYWLVEESNRDGTAFEKPVQAEKKSSFLMDGRGAMFEFQGDGVPLLRSFPLAPPQALEPGLIWEAPGEWVVDPKADGVLTRVPILVQYRAVKRTEMGGQEAWEVVAKFALRYRKGQDRAGDPELTGAQGTQDAVIYLSAADYSPLFIRAKTEELFQYAGGKSIANSGFYLTFYNGVVPLNKVEESRKLEEVVSTQAIPDLTITPEAAGVRLTLDNLLFVPDQAVLLPGENGRLDKIATLLKGYPGRSLLVTGHTAAVGSQESQLALSRQRAQMVVEELKKRGVEARRLLFEGRGGSQPVADNATEDGRQKNRRVEILILED